MPNEYSEDDLKNMSAEEIAELQRQNCIFCKIAAKEIPAKIVHEDADVICILDINPASEGHILVYPKKHYMIMPHIPDDVLSKVFKDVKLMSHTLLKALQCKGTTIFVANGVAAGQKAPHVLVHVFPRRDNDGLVKLPSYEMNEQQVSKLKNDLKPYVNQLFGVKRSTPVVKEAEFTDNNDDKNTSEQQDRITKDSAVKPNEHKDHVKDSTKEPVKREKKMPDKSDTPAPKDNNSRPQTNSPKGNINLDDIAKLFGG